MSRSVIICVSLAALGQSALAQKDKVLAVREWEGTLTAAINSSGKTATGWEWKAVASVNVTFVLDKFDPGYARWTGRYSGGTASISLSSKGPVFDVCTQTVTSSGSGPLTAGSPNIDPLELLVPVARNEYRFNFSGSLSMLQKSTIECPFGTESGSDLRTQSVLRNAWSSAAQYMALPSDSTTLALSTTTEYYPPSGLMALDRLPGMQLKFEIRPWQVEELELEIDSAQYAKWRPTAQRDGSPGDPIQLTATLKRKDGGSPQGEIALITWELLDTSTEPGISINYPLNAKDQDFDMRLEAASPGQLYESEKQQKVVSPNVKSFTDTVAVRPTDWGAWSTLRVTAEMTDGRKFAGKFKGSTEENVRLPRRASGSFIADGWKEEQGVSGPDSGDEESAPEGDGNPGDGLTLYEEYRGFYMAGDHREGNPKKKDYFALNQAGNEGQGGLVHFKRLSGLTVHSDFQPAEFDVNHRVINANKLASPHRVDQHGVWLKYDGERPDAQAVSTGKRPSTPGNILYVAVPTNIPARRTRGAVNYSSLTIAHELFHTVNVWHHGEVDLEVLWRREGAALLEYKVDDNGNIFGTGVPIRVFREDLSERTPAYVSRLGEGDGVPQMIGIRNGQHSGFEDCVMRYDIASAYIAETNAADRFQAIPSEIPGTRLCDAATGFAVNADGRSPQPRYFSAAPGRGDCKHQILVNDAVSAPGR